MKSELQSLKRGGGCYYLSILVTVGFLVDVNSKQLACEERNSIFLICTNQQENLYKSLENVLQNFIEQAPTSDATTCINTLVLNLTMSVNFSHRIAGCNSSECDHHL